MAGKIPPHFIEFLRLIQKRDTFFLDHDDQGLSYLVNKQGYVMPESEFNQLVSDIRLFYESKAPGEIELYNAFHQLRLLVSGDAEKAKQKSKKAGYVYIIRAETGEYKIGRTKNIDQRMQFFGVKLPFDFDVVHVIPTHDMFKTEKVLHGIYDYARCNGEWFNLTDNDIEYLKAELSTVDAPDL